MSIISVEGKSLGAELAVWGVPHNYAVAFAEKSASKKWPHCVASVLLQ